MRRLIVTTTVAAALSAAAFAAEAAEIGPVSEIRISFGQDIVRKPKIYGAREKARLEKELRGQIEKAVGGLKSGGGVLELVIEDAKPNRPTWTQMTFEPGISYIDSFGIGGAKIEGAYVAPSGERTKVGYTWYETDIRNSQFVSDWHDAERTFNRFAKRLADG